MEFWNNRHNWSSDIFRDGSRIADLTADFTISGNSQIITFGYANLRHKGIAPGVVGISARIGYRRKNTLAEHGPKPTTARENPLWNEYGNEITWIAGAKDGVNIIDVTDHYRTINLQSMIALGEGAYRFEVWLFSMTNLVGYEYRDDLVCINRDTNQSEIDTFGFFGGMICPL